MLVFESTHLDLFVQDLLYRADTGRWLADRDNAVLRLLFYDGLKALYAALLLAVVVALTRFRHRPWVRQRRRALVIVLLSCILVPLSVDALKDLIDIPCPKNTERYGGTYPHVTLFHRHAAETLGMKPMACYPAGHASSGFALLALLFLCRTRRTKVTAAAAILALAWAAGIYNMAIGDHFLSHTLVSMILAWLVISVSAGTVDRGTARCPTPQPHPNERR